MKRLIVGRGNDFAARHAEASDKSAEVAIPATYIEDPHTGIDPNVAKEARTRRW
ncbi:hypothetical protein [Novosphingobium sp. ZW T3_23]|uniref:hypothetical protein n=1 Tax=Novosphingobium sp. ZW T3_23 TaxID=3378084 RepID=UPI0038535B3F